MNNLFSVFDPSSSVFFVPNWISGISFFILIPSTYWFMPSTINTILLNLKMTLHREMKTLLGPQSYGGSTLFLLAAFFFIGLSNFMGLFPYIFTSTSHMSTSLSLALPLWLAFMMFGWLNYTKYMLAHLVPQGTPPALMSFMVLIETVSNLIRPGTLAIRLSANMIAGHLLLTLLGNQTATVGPLLLTSLLVVQILLLTLESAVAIIQSYVFMVLSTLYSSESTSH
uniref:ATP synthase subunit a n=1 Tax=Tullbergia mixta TaxID=1499077 RepID=A0A7T7BW39_9HEXA|nr:ATP synthase F0 subunit 6 [Tullbergia mixta]QQK54722.1 ATP synthase F0 subunit 6 [Tullbergia mixta]